MQFAQHIEPLPSWNITSVEPVDDLSSLWDTPSELWNLAANTNLPAADQTADPLVIPLGSVGSGTANFLDDLPDAAQPKRANSKEDRKLAVSREAQKRFRARQKVGSVHTVKPCLLPVSTVSVGTGQAAEYRD